MFIKLGEVQGKWDTHQAWGSVVLKPLANGLLAIFN